MPASTARRTVPGTRTARLVLVTLLLGGVLAVVPRPAFAIERGVRVDTETPELTAVTLDADQSRSADASQSTPDTDPGATTPDTTTPGEAVVDGPEGDASDSAHDHGEHAASPTSGTDRLSAQADGIDDFELIGATFTSAATDDARIRVHIDGEWAPWQSLTGIDGDHGPDPGSAEAANGQPASDPIWVGDGDGYELDLPPDAADVRVHLVRETEEQVRIVDGTAEAGAYRMPTVNSRRSWGARNPRRSPQVADTVNTAIVHHTVNSNAYSPQSVPGMLRSIQAYHMDAQGWDDIGYNFVVDRFGRAWEGRSNSTYKAVVGAHSKNSNSGSTGIAWLGDGTGAGLTASGHEAIARLIAWKLPLHGTFFSGREIVGHRDRFPTSCPGNAVHRQLGSIRNRAVAVRPPAGPFLDVPNRAWNASHLTWGKETGIVTGYRDGNFRPDTNVNRAQFVSMLWHLVGEPRSNVRHGLSDVPRSSWITPALDWAKANGIVTGYDDGTFRGGNAIGRANVVVILWRWATAPVVSEPHGFSDVPAGGWADAALAWAKATGVVTGYADGTFRQSQPVSRGQLVPMLYDVRPFTDIAPSAWHQAGAHWGLHQGISLGYPDRTFRGDNNVNRAQATSMLWRTMDSPTDPAPADHGWPDVDADAWYDLSLDWATAAGVVDGKPDGGFHGADAMLRHETVLWVWRMAGSPAATSAHGLTDVPDGAVYAAALDWAIEHGIVSGFGDGTFHPDDPVTRAQWMMTLYRLARNEAAWVGGAAPPTTTVF